MRMVIGGKINGEGKGSTTLVANLFTEHSMHACSSHGRGEQAHGLQHRSVRLVIMDEQWEGAPTELEALQEQVPQLQ